MVTLAVLPYAGTHGSEFSGLDLSRFGDAPTASQAQAAAISPVFELPDGTKFNRAPRDMRSWEIHASYRLAWHLACFLPSTALARALADWLCAAQCELERRGEWQPEALPPQSM
jgi:hypothetical protein